MDTVVEQRSFNIANERELVQLLKAVRHSSLSPAMKDQIRDSVFSLTDKENSIIIKGLQATLADVGIAITYSRSLPVTLIAPDAAEEDKAQPKAKIFSFTPASINTTVKNPSGDGLEIDNEEDKQKIAPTAASSSNISEKYEIGSLQDVTTQEVSKKTENTEETKNQSETLKKSIVGNSNNELTEEQEADLQSVSKGDVSQSQNADESKKKVTKESNAVMLGEQKDDPQVNPTPSLVDKSTEAFARKRVATSFSIKEPITSTSSSKQLAPEEKETPKLEHSTSNIFSENKILEGDHTTQESKTSSVPRADLPGKEVPVPPIDNPSTETKTATENSITPRFTAAAAMDRIKEIKRNVNSVVGNPVNLISKDKEIGRTYMAAMLEAMRVASADGDVQSAMAKLESVYKKVRPILHSEDTPIKKPVVDKPLEPAATHSVPSQSVVQDSASVAPRQPEQAPEPASTQKLDVPPVSNSTSVAQRQQMHPENADIYQSGSKDHSTIVMRKIAPAVQAETLAQAVTSAPSRVRETHDMLRQLADEEDRKAHTGDVLNFPEVTEGLSQLLREWDLFKKSGLLGTGPKGTEHPLYKELRNLKMDMIISGRFEGATPEVRQSIIDYMNGWRYEHGIIHEMDETFEHYLRKVVHIILKKKS